MPKQGRPTVPTEIKRKRGTARPDRSPNLGNLAAVPAVDAELTDLSTSDALARVLEAGVVWIASTDAPKVALLRESLEDYDRVRSAGDFKQAMALRKQIAGLMADLGFDPSARARLGLAEVKAESKMEELRRKRSGG